VRAADLGKTPAALRVEGENREPVANPGASGHHLGYRTLGNQQVWTDARVEKHRAPPTVIVEAELRALLISCSGHLVIQRIGGIEDRGVEWARRVTTEYRMQHRMLAHIRAVAAVRPHRSDQSEGTAGECAGLVDAEHVHTGQILNGGRAGNDHTGPRQRRQPAPECGREHYRQEFWHQPDSDRDREQRGLLPVQIPIDQLRYRESYRDEYREQSDQ
jgi:hypothetical protein